MSKPSPARYRTTNWSSYNAALRKRGSMLIWVDQGDGLVGAAKRSPRPSSRLLRCRDPILPLGQGAVQAALAADRRQGCQLAAAGGAGLVRVRLKHLVS